MSLVITSNVGELEGNAPIMNGINLPYNYHNYLSQPLELEPNSEVAVQSVKIVKVGNNAIDISNNTFYLYQGKDDANSTISTGEFDVDKTTSLPVRCQIGEAKRTEVNSEKLATLVEESLRRGMCNPNLVQGDFNASGVEVTTERESGSSDFGKFLGFDIKFHQKTSASNTDTKSNLEFNNLLGLDADFNGSWNSTTHRISKPSANEFCEMIGETPLSNCSGIFKFSFKEAGGDWEVGLTRWKNYLTDDYTEQEPTYFDNGGDVDNTFYDWVAKSVEDENGKLRLRLYHAVIKGDTSSDLTMEEFEYWSGGPASGSLTEPIEIFDTSASYGTTNISELEFTILNEQVVVFVQSSDGSSASHTLANGKQANKLHNLKPVAITNRYMYPQVKIIDHNAYVEIQKYNGVTPTGWDYISQAVTNYNTNLNSTQNRSLDHQLDMTNPQYDFWARIVNTDGELEYGQEVDVRYMFDLDNTTAYTQLGLNASLTLDTQINMILKEDDDFLPSEGANAGRLLGFPNTPLLRASLRNTDTAILQQYISNSIPVQFSKGSVFVALNNFTQQSYNGQTRGPSKILYHLPRFDNSGANTGALFFEPSEKTYVKLNNINPLIVNDFELSLVNADNKLADNLTGKTIIVLHFRKSIS